MFDREALLRPGMKSAGAIAKCIVAPDGSEIVPTSKPQPDGTLVKALARAWRWQRLDGRPAPCLPQLLKSFSVEWEKQRAQFL